MILLNATYLNNLLTGQQFSSGSTTLLMQVHTTFRNNDLGYRRSSCMQQQKYHTIRPLKSQYIGMHISLLH